MKKFFKIPAYSDLCGFVRNRGKFLQITVIFALRGVVGSRGRNAAVALAKSPLAALKVLTEAHTEETATFLEQDSTTVPNFANRSFCPMGILLGLPPQARLLRLAPLEKFLKNFFGFFKKHFRLCPCFSPIGERANHKEKGVEAHEKIQHAPPPPGNQDTLDRGRIRRVFRACHPLQNEPSRVYPASPNLIKHTPGYHCFPGQ